MRPEVGTERRRPDSGYEEMAADEGREAAALAGADDTIGDVSEERADRTDTFETNARDDAMRRRRRRLAAEQAAVLSKVQSALFVLRERLGVRTAYVVGSLKSPERWHETSDVDVAVGGCSRDVLEVMKALEEATKRPVDVIDLDRHPFPEACVRAGIRVYG